MATERIPLAQRFWSKVDKRGPDECWPWTAAIDNKGYGRFGIRAGMMRGAHQVAYWLTYGQTDKGVCVCHRCDNPPCCNPAHLFKATHAENMLDRDKKGRHRNGGLRGETHGSAKLTEVQVLAIRVDPRRQVDIAQEYGITQVAVSQIKLRKSWRHL